MDNYNSRSLIKIKYYDKLFGLKDCTVDYDAFNRALYNFICNEKIDCKILSSTNNGIEILHNGYLVQEFKLFSTMYKNFLFEVYRSVWHKADCNDLTYYYKGGAQDAKLVFQEFDLSKLS